MVHFRDRRGAALLYYRKMESKSRLLMYEQKPYPVWFSCRSKSYPIKREYFIESAGVRHLHTSCFCIRNRTSERSERVRFLIQKQRVRKYCTKHFPCGIVFIIYILRRSSFWRPFYFKSFKNAKNVC